MEHSKLLYLQATLELNGTMSVDSNINYEQVVYNLSSDISEPTELTLSAPDRLRNHVKMELDKLDTHIFEVNDGSVTEISRYLFIKSVTDKVYDKFN